MLDDTRTLAGRYGIAEQVGGSPPPCIGRWVATTKFWHHEYSQYAIILLTLADVEQLQYPPPSLVHPGMTHAISSVTLNPAQPYSTNCKLGYMFPINLEAQFACDSDEQAVVALRCCVEEVIDGNLNPESGTRPNLNVDEWTDYINGVLL